MDQSSTLSKQGEKPRSGQDTTTIPSAPSDPAPERPLSFAQQRLWFLDQLNSRQKINNVTRVLRLRGRLDPLMLEQCFSAIVQRHETLRSVFVEINGKPLQKVLPHADVRLEIVDLRMIPGAEREKRAHEIAVGEAYRSFDLGVGPLLGNTLIRLDDEEHLLLVTMHHVITDGWSMGVLSQELELLYNGFCHGIPPSLPDLPLQYPDYAVWQRQDLTEEKLEQLLAYWSTNLEGVVRAELPSDQGHGFAQTNKGSQRSQTLPTHVRDQLHHLAQEQGCTLFTLLVAAFNALLHRYTGQEDILVGVPVAGRRQHDVQALIGFFVNTVVLRTGIIGDLTFRELLSQVNATVRNALSHSELPFEKLVQALQPERSLDQNPLTDILINFKDSSWKTFNLSGLTVTAQEIDELPANFALTLNIEERENGLVFQLLYQQDLFSDAHIRSLLQHFCNLLQGIAENIDQPVSRLPLLTPSECDQLVHEWNETSTAYPRDRCIHELFEDQVTATPDAIALVCRGETLTYAELNERANRLANFLAGLGIGSDTPVALLLERSLDMVTAIIAILKAGGGYVPLDTASPPDRLQFMLADTGAPVLVTQEELQELAPGYAGTTVCIDRDWPQIVRMSGTDSPGDGVMPDNLAYVMYTSGSTGKPKGVAIPHRGVTRLVTGVDYIRFGQEEVFLLLAPMSFDA
jgi:uncharacterized protein Usg